jgi:hypothetical protein
VNNMPTAINVIGNFDLRTINAVFICVLLLGKRFPRSTHSGVRLLTQDAL